MDAAEYIGKKIYSKILNENFVINNQNSVVFESGIEYNKYDILQLKKESIKTRQKIHLIKNLFEL